MISGMGRTGTAGGEQHTMCWAAPESGKEA